MHKQRPKILKYRTRKSKYYGLFYTLRCIGMRYKLQCGTPFLYRIKSVYRFYRGFSFADLERKIGCCSSRILDAIYCFIYGCLKIVASVCDYPL